MSPTIVWFRQDLRLQDNAALDAAVKRGAAVVPVYILDDEGDVPWALGGASRSWLHCSLAAMEERLRELGSRLILARGDSAEVLRNLVETTKAGAVYWNRRYEPAIRVRDLVLREQLIADGVDAQSFGSTLLFEPEAVANKQGRPFQVFTPFWRHCQSLPVLKEIRLKVGALPRPRSWPASLRLAELALRPQIPWDVGFYEQTEPGERGAQKQMKRTLARVIDRYHESRNLPAEPGTSRLSAHLHFGEIGPRQVWAAVMRQFGDARPAAAPTGLAVFLAEIGWREFAYHLLFHFPETPTRPLRREFEAFPWANDPDGSRLRAWQQGRTGYPIVDAGMRELWQTGWMHNRVRMIVASFLVKHLRLDWFHGAAWFWDTLTDADLASNTLGWQWSAGCGADAAPYFRIFAPVLQGGKFDPAGEYVRRWVPELRRLPIRFIHQPWIAPPAELKHAGVDLGRTYPRPIVDHARARADALAAFQKLRSKKESSG